MTTDTTAAAPRFTIPRFMVVHDEERRPAYELIDADGTCVAACTSPIAIDAASRLLNEQCGRPRT